MNLSHSCAARRIEQSPILDAVWDKAPWTQQEPETLRHFMGQEPSHRPTTRFKVAYDTEAIYVIFQVNDRYVRSVTTTSQGPVWTDSCVEFFFTPDNSGSSRYFNLEVNCGGTALFAFQAEAGKPGLPISPEDCSRITLAHSLPAVVDPERTEPVTWTVEYRLPVDILEKYGPVTRPGPGVAWRANFYKCADKSSHPHWLTWSPVNYPSPRFHLPEFFGTLNFR